MSTKLLKALADGSSRDEYLVLTQPELEQNSRPALPYQRASTTVTSETQGGAWAGAKL